MRTCQPSGLWHVTPCMSQCLMTPVSMPCHCPLGSRWIKLKHHHDGMIWCSASSKLELLNPAIYFSWVDYDINIIVFMIFRVWHWDQQNGHGHWQGPGFQSRPGSAGTWSLVPAGSREPGLAGSRDLPGAGTCREPGLAESWQFSHCIVIRLQNSSNTIEVLY